MNKQDWRTSLTFANAQIFGFVHTPVYKAPKETKRGIAFLHFVLLTLRDPTGKRTDKNTVRHRCFAYGDLADYLRSRLRHGDLCYVEGKLSYFTTERPGKSDSWTAYVNIHKISIVPSSSHHFQRAGYPGKRDRQKKGEPPADTFTPY